VTLPSSTGKEIKPCIEIMDGKEFNMIWTNNPNYKGPNKKNVMSNKFTIFSYKVGVDNSMIIEIEDVKKKDLGVRVCGDLYFRLYNTKNNNLICRFAMNTAFVNSESNVYTFDKKGVDPDSIIKNKKFENDFKINLFFSDECNLDCKPSKPLTMLCNDCKITMVDEIKEWMIITKIIDGHKESMRKITEKFEEKEGIDAHTFEKSDELPRT
jgi:hypothetical protein